MRAKRLHNKNKSSNNCSSPEDDNLFIKTRALDNLFCCFGFN